MDVLLAAVLTAPTQLCSDQSRVLLESVGHPRLILLPGVAVGRPCQFVQPAWMYWDVGKENWWNCGGGYWG